MEGGCMDPLRLEAKPLDFLPLKFDSRLSESKSNTLQRIGSSEFGALRWSTHRRTSRP